MTMFAKFRLMQEIVAANKAGHENTPAVIRVENERKLLELNQSLEQLARGGNPLASYSYSKEVYSLLRSGNYGHLEKIDQQEAFKICHEYLKFAASKGVSSAYFILGMIYMEGIFVKPDPEKAFD